MKKLLLSIVFIAGLFSFALGNNYDLSDTVFLENEHELTIEIDNKELINATKEQRDLRLQQKQEIKNQILELYRELKDEKIRGTKKETRHQISQLKRQLRTINTKIAYSYKQQFKKFFGLNK